MTRKFSVIALCLIFLAACGVNWQSVSKGGFKVDMPGSPSETNQTISTPAGPTTVSVYSVDAKGEAFVVSFNDYPGDAVKAVDAEQLLNSARTGAITKVNGKVTSERSINLNGKPGKEIVGDATTPQEGTFTYRLYWDSPRLYQVLYVRPKGAEASENGKKFLDSFQLTGAK